MNINTFGKFEMFGDFIVQEGQYNFKYGGIIDKKFDVEKEELFVGMVNLWMLF